MRSLCFTLAAALTVFALLAQAKSAFLRAGNKFGDYWIFRFAGQTINMRYDVDHKMQKESDREIKISDIDVPASLIPPGSSVADPAAVVFRPSGGNLAKIRLKCKNMLTNNCVYSHFDSSTSNELDVLCENEADCVAFVQALALQ